MLTPAQIRAQKKYDLKNKDKFHTLSLKLNKELDSDILEKLQSENNVQGYIKALIRKDLGKE